jgi:formylmethanofuran dehydrogenase subunit C
VNGLLLTLRDAPAQRLDLAPLTPERLTGLSEREIGKIELQTTRERVCVGDMFRLRMGDAAQIRIAGGSERFDRIGDGMSGGAITVEGDAGIQAGRQMRGGRLTINGHAGPFAASGMRGGVIEIAGDARERLGGPLAGEMAGMRGGVVVVRGNAGPRAGDRLRRGVIVIEGAAGAYAGSRMIAGTLMVRGRAGPLPGYLMARGTLVLAAGCAGLSPTFADCGVHDFVASTLMAAFIAPYSAHFAALLRHPWRRLIGDLAGLGKGEILMPPA